jgi:hypothetical protein
MKWKRIPKENAVQPEGKYSDWKHLLAEEGFHQCVYCALHDATFGERNFHVEHYKPKSNYRFKHLEHDIRNLFYACPVCNVFKGSSWPRAPRKDHSVESFPNPSKFDYCDLFDVIESTGQLRGKYVASKFLVVKLHLNREQLIVERRFFRIRERLGKLASYIDSVKGDLIQSSNDGDTKAGQYLFQLLELYKAYLDLFEEYLTTPTYSPQQLT